MARIASVTDSARRGLMDSVTMLPGLVSSLEDARVQAIARQDSLRDAEAQLHNVLLALTSKTLREYLVEARGVLQERSHALIAIGEVASPQNQPLLQTYARAQRRLPQLVTKVAEASDSLWRAIKAQDFAAMADTTQLKLWNGNVDNLRAVLDELSASDEPLPSESALAELTVSVMRDAEVIVRQTGAQVGDVLVLTVMDTAGTQNANRTLELRLPIREFGFVRRMSDAVLLMNVPGVAEKEEIAEAQATADATNQGSSLAFPLNLRGAPSAGVTLGWTYLPRLDDDFAKVPYPLRVIFNWLRPGVGLNASVVSIGHKIITVTPKAATSEAAQEPEVAYTFGVVGTVFESAVQWSIGRTLTGDHARTYTGLGISFLAATDKAKDLFKALAK